MKGGEIENRSGRMGKKKKKSFLERGLEAVLGAFLAYLSGSATGFVQVILLIAGVVIIIYALFAD
ncbi:hypothetical protein MUP77_23660 [Candidatus Bathyarchaeota archaeon]|nr:hypothetical protein [Candidatus Bathyarchaeota archaeon]